MKAHQIIIGLISFLLFYACQSTAIKYVNPTLDDGKYDSEFPYRSSSKQLEEITNSVKMVNCIAYYSAFIFDQKDQILKSGISGDQIKKHAKEMINYTKTASGTGTIISNERNGAVLLTCAHVVYFPDTVITYYKDDFGKQTRFIESIAFKDKQTNYIPDFPLGGEVDILLIDNKLDLAVLGKHFDLNDLHKFPEFKFPTGEAKELEWGTFVYTIGYPMNYKMISKGIVSSPNRDNNGSFLIDAVFNRGFSGGIVLAIKDGIPNFELVGLVNTVPASKEYFLVPEKNEEEHLYSSEIPYKGVIYPKQILSIRYGITKVIPIEQIIDFLKKNEKTLNDMDYYVSLFLKK